MDIQTEPYMERTRLLKANQRLICNILLLDRYLLLTHMKAELSADPLSLVAWHVYKPWSSTVIRSMWRVPSSGDITMPEDDDTKFNTPDSSVYLHKYGNILPDPCDRARSSLYHAMLGRGTPSEGQRRVTELLTLTL